MAEQNTQKELDGWVEVFLFDPLTSPLVPFASRYISRNPLFYTLVSFSLGIAAGILVWYHLFTAAGITYFFSIVFDGLDGKIARHNNLLVLRHGILDVTGDFIKNLFMLFALHAAWPEFASWFMLFALLLVLYEATYAIRQELKYRYFSAEIRPGYSMTELKRGYEEQISHLGLPIASATVRAYNYLFTFTRQHRTYPFPTLVDAEFVVFVLFPLLPTVTILHVANLFLLPDVLMSLFLTLLLTFRAEQKRG